MAKKKSISISLAAKCQLLFGLAVLVIIAGALAVPWQRMEQLAGQPNVKAARFAADLLFREVHARGSEGAAGSGAMWNDITLSDSDYPRPRIVKLNGPGNDAAAGMGEDPLGQQAVRIFRAKPGEFELGRVVTLADKSRVYRYAAAVRLEATCLKCHGEYVSWLKPRVAVGGTAGPAMTMAATLPAGVGGSATAPAVPAPATMAGTDDVPTLVIEPPVPSPATAPAAATTHPAVAPVTATPAVWPLVAIVRVDVPYQTDENQLLLNRIVIVVSGMLGGTLAIVVFFLITSRLILQPVRVLKNTAEKVAKGDLNIRSAISTGDEFQQLSETFNHMLATLKGSQDQLEASNRSLDTRVGELAQSNVDLYEANRIKSEFLTNVTHELRTPLNAITGFADLLAGLAKAGGDAKQERYVENIRASAKQLLDLINDLLDLAKIEAGKIVLREEKVNVADVCEAMANFMRPLAQKKNIELELTVAPDMPLITTDPGRFQQILYNFLSNAIKFTPADGKVAIAAQNELPALAGAPEAGGATAERLILPSQTAPGVAGSPAVRVSITDSGPGISPEDQKVIFEKFRQIDGSVTRQHSGTGLGLAISRELANMLGARIELQSIPGKGAVFSLIMPTENRRRTVEIHATLENA